MPRYYTYVHYDNYGIIFSMQQNIRNIFVSRLTYFFTQYFLLMSCIENTPHCSVKINTPDVSIDKRFYLDVRLNVSAFILTE